VKYVNSGENPLIGIEIARYKHLVAKMEFDEGCGCIGGHCIEMKNQTSLYIHKCFVKDLIRSKTIIKRTWISGFTAIPIAGFILRSEFILNQPAISIPILISQYAAFIVSILLLHMIDSYLLNKVVKQTCTFSNIRNEYCDGCVVFARCSKACGDFCNYKRNEYIFLNIQLNHLPLMGDMKAYCSVERSIQRYIKMCV